MTELAARRFLAPILAIALLVAVPASAAAKPAGPQTAKCGKLKKKAAKQRCLQQNKANRVAFDQIKNGRYVGQRGDGEYLDETFCANGRFRSVTDGRYGRAIASGDYWFVQDAVVRNGGKWINAVIADPDGFQIAIQKRGPRWLIGVPRSFGEVSYPGEMQRTDASAACPTLEI